MSAPKTGGPAFPSRATLDGLSFTDGSSWVHPGATLRDYFAAKYIAGYIANPGSGFPTRQEAAEQAYLMADAMLKARAL